MIDETALRQTLVMFAVQLKENHSTILSMMGELASLREAVRGLDPTFADVLAAKRQDMRQTVSEEYLSQMRQYDSLIQRLRDGLVC